MLIEEVEKKIDEVLEKDIKGAFVGGYKRKDVDLFLDELVEFYEHIIANLTESEKDDDVVVRENLKLKNQVLKLQQQLIESQKSKEFDKIILKQKIIDMNQEMTNIRGNR